MKNNLIITTLCLFSMFASGCSTYVKVWVQKPSEINIGRIKRIAIADFNVNSNIQLGTTKTLGQIAAQALVDIAFEKLANKKNNYEEKKYNADNISNRLYAKLTGTNYFKLIKRDNNFNTAGSVNVQSDVDAVMSGFANYNVRDYVEIVDDVTKKNGVTIRNKKFQIRRNVDTSISYQIINTLNGRVVASRTLSDSDSEVATGDTQDEALGHLRDWYYTVDNQVTGITARISKQIAPYYVTEDLEIKDGKSNNMKRAVEYAKRSLWDDAKSQWQEVMDNPASDKEDKIFATYNLGIYHEVKGELDQAGNFFDECFKKSGKSECVNAKSRIQTRKIELERLTQNN